MQLLNIYASFDEILPNTTNHISLSVRDKPLVILPEFFQLEIFTRPSHILSRFPQNYGMSVPETKISH